MTSTAQPDKIQVLPIQKKELIRDYILFYKHNDNNDESSYIKYSDCFKNIKTSIDFVNIFVSSKYILPHISQIYFYSKEFITYYPDMNIDMPITVYNVSIGGIIFGKTIHIRHPDKKTIDYIHNLLYCNNIKYSVSKIEYTIDIYTKYYKEIFHDMKISSILKNQLKNNILVDVYEETQYHGDPRNDKNKASRIYIKDVDGEKNLRVEIILKNRFIKRNIKKFMQKCNIKNYKNRTHIDVRILASQRAEDVFSSLLFKRIMMQKIIAKAIKVLGSEIDALDDIHDNIVKTIYDEGILYAIRNISKYSKTNKSTYIDTHPLHHAFFNAIKGRHFI